MTEILKKPSRSSLILLFILVVVGASLRLINLEQSSFWVEEVKHVYGAKSFLENGEFALPSGLEYKRALPFTFLVSVSFKLFGINEFSARLPSAIFGTLSILLVFFVGKGLFNERVGLIAALFLTFLPWEIGWSRVCRMYTMFQFLFLAGIYTFYKGFESDSPVWKLNFLGKSKIAEWINAWSIDWRWLILSGLILLASLGVHRITGLFFLSVLIYLFLMFLITAFTNGLASALKSKYLGLFVFLTGFAGLVLFAVPGLLQEIIDLANFYPYWYELLGPRHNLYYLHIIVSEMKFPIGVLFLIGAIHAALRLNKTCFFLLICFGIPFFMHSFIFAMKSDKYIFNIFPLYLLVAAYGLSNIIGSEMERVQHLLAKLKSVKVLSALVNERNIKILVYMIFFAWLPVSRWFFNAFELPTIRSGSGHLGGSYTNGAVTHRDWREACQYVDNLDEDKDVIITTHSLNIFYYLNKVNFVLYRGDLDEIQKYNKTSEDGLSLEPFVDAKYIDSLTTLKQIMQQNKRGWLILDKSRFNKDVYIQREIADFIRENMERHKTGADGTLYVFSWDRAPSDTVSRM